jgi:hypothetical protein
MEHESFFNAKAANWHTVTFFGICVNKANSRGAWIQREGKLVSTCRREVTCRKYDYREGQRTVATWAIFFSG